MHDSLMPSGREKAMLPCGCRAGGTGTQAYRPICMAPRSDQHTRRGRRAVLPDQDAVWCGSSDLGSQQVFQPNRGIVLRIYTDIELAGHGLQLAMAVAVQIDGPAMLTAPRSKGVVT